MPPPVFARPNAKFASDVDILNVCRIEAAILMNTHETQGSSRKRRRQKSRINTRLGLILFVALAISGTTIHFLHGYMVGRNATNLLDRAERLLTEAEQAKVSAQSSENDTERVKLLKEYFQKRREAVRYLQQYVQLKPDDYNAWVTLAETSDETITNPRQRRLVYERLAAALRKLEAAQDAPDAEDLTPTIHKLRRRFIEVALMGNLPKSALEEIKKFPKELRTKDAGLLFHQGRCQYLLLEWKKAADSFEDAINSAPGRIDSYLALMQLVATHPTEIEFREYDPDGREDPTSQEVADSLANEMVKQGKPSYRALLQRALYRQSRSAESADEGEREAKLAAARKDIQDSVQAHESLLAQAADTKKTDDAVGTSEIDPAEDIEPLLKGSTIFTASARLASEMGRGDDLKKFSTQAREYAQAALERKPSNPQCYLVLAGMTLSENSTTDPENINYEAPIQYFQDGLKRAEQSTVIAQQLRWELANTLINAGMWHVKSKPDELSPEYKTLIEQLKKFGARKERTEFLNARLAFQQKEWQKAIQLLEAVQPKLIGDDRLTLRVDFMLGACYGRLGDADAQLRAYQRAAQLSPLNQQLRFQITSALTQLGRIDEALEELRLSSFAIPRVAGTLAQLYVEKYRQLPSQERQWTRVRGAIDGLLANLEKTGRKPSEDWTSVTVSQAQLFVFQAARLATQNTNDPALVNENLKQAGHLLAEGERLLRVAIDDPQGKPEAQYWIELANLRFQRALLEKDENKAQSIRQQVFEILDEAQQQLGDRVELRSARAKAFELIEMYSAEYAAKQTDQNEGNQAAREKQRAEAVRAIIALSENTEKFTDDTERALLWRNISLSLLRLRETEQSQRFAEKLLAVQPYNLGMRLQLLNLAFLKLTAEEIPEGGKKDRQEHLKKVTDIVNGIREFEGPNGPIGNYASGMQLLAEINYENQQNSTKNAKLSKAKLDRARELLQAAVKRRPSLAAIHRALGQVEMLAQNDQAAAEHLRQAVGHGDLSTFTINRLVPLLSRLKRDQEVVDIVAKIKDRNPEMLTESQELDGTPQIGSLNTNALLRIGSFDKAIDSVRDSLPDKSDYRYHLTVGQIKLIEARRQKNVGKAKDVERNFREAVRLAPEKKDPWLALVGYLLEAGRRDDAEQEIANARKQLVDEYQHAIMASLLRLVGNRDEAEAEYEAALKQHPDNIRVLGSVLDFYRKNGKTDLAEEKLKAALARNPQNAELHGIAAGFYNQSREKEKRALTLKYLEKILDKKDELAPALVKFARRRKALFIAASGGYKNSEKARKILELNLTEERPETADLQALVGILGKQANLKARKKQIELLKQINKRQQLSSAGKLQLAKLYEQTGKWHEARPLLLSLATSETNQAYYMGYFVRGLRRNKEFADAEIWLDQLKQLMPQSFVTVILEAEYEAAQNNGERAVQLIQDYLEQDAVITPEQTFQDLVTQGRVAEALQPLKEYVEAEKDEVAKRVLERAGKLLAEEKTEEATELLKRLLRRDDMRELLAAARYKLAAIALSKVGEIEAAEKIYRQYMEMIDNPDNIAELIILVGRQDRIDEALDLCDKAWDTLPPETAAYLSTTVVRNRTSTPQQLERVAKRLEQTVQKDSKSTSIMTHLADLRDRQGLYSQAETAYRWIVGHSDHNVMAFNNLAWLLAIQKKEGITALEMINKAIDLAGPQSELLDTRAVVYLSLNQPKKALSDLQEAVIGAKEDASMYFHLAQAELALKNYSEARKTMSEALSAGLTKSSLHPLELPEYQSLMKELKLQKRNEEL